MCLKGILFICCVCLLLLLFRQGNSALLVLISHSCCDKVLSAPKPKKLQLGDSLSCCNVQVCVCVWECRRQKKCLGDLMSKFSSLWCKESHFEAISENGKTINEEQYSQSDYYYYLFFFLLVAFVKQNMTSDETRHIWCIFVLCAFREWYIVWAWG